MDDKEFELELKKYRQEWWKSGISALLTIAVVFLGWSVQYSLVEQKAALDRKQQIISSKQNVYADVGKLLNNIYIYAADVGEYSAFTPVQVISFKRQADSTFYTYGAYWSDETKAAFTAFEEAAFAQYQGAGLPARIRGYSDQKVAAYQRQNKTWEPGWGELFTGEQDPQLKAKYDKLVGSLLSDAVDPKIRPRNAD